MTVAPILAHWGQDREDGHILLPGFRMSIPVVCPGCRTRFKVSDRFAGQSGACPKCKAKIEVPAQVDPLPGG